MNLKHVNEAIDQALDACKALDATGGLRVSNRDVVAWIRKHRPEVAADHNEWMADEHLMKLIASRRKDREPIKEIERSQQICMDFGLPDLQLDSEISIPHNPADPIYGGCDWLSNNDASLHMIDLHIKLLEAQAAANMGKANNWRRVRQAAARYANGDLSLTLGELRARARGDQARGVA